jgi:hypothetical protein
MPRNDDVRRKLVEFDAETWQAVDLLARDQMKSFQELASEASAICCASIIALPISKQHSSKAPARRSRQDRRVQNLGAAKARAREAQARQ